MSETKEGPMRRFVVIAVFETEGAADRAVAALNPGMVEDEAAWGALPEAVTTIDVEDATFATLALMVPRNGDLDNVDIPWEEAVIDLGGPPTEAEDGDDDDHC